MKYFVVSDVHGFFDEFMDALLKAGYDKDSKDHCLVVLGDLLDRGRKPLACLEFVNSIPSERKILIRGNHEDLMDEMLTRGEYLSHDIHNGTLLTVADLFKSVDVPSIFCQMARYEPWIKYNESLVDYAEVGDYIFVHGWVPTWRENRFSKKCKVLGKNYWSLSTWKDARWTNGMEAWRDGARIPNKTIVCGHWHCSWGWSNIRQERKEFPQKNSSKFAASFEPFVDDGIIAIDSCVAYTGFINCVVLDI